MEKCSLAKLQFRKSIIMFFAEMEILEFLSNPLTLVLLTTVLSNAPLKFSSELQRIIEVMIKGMLVIATS